MIDGILTFKLTKDHLSNGKVVHTQWGIRVVIDLSELKGEFEAIEKELEIKSASLKRLMSWVEETGNYPPTDNPPLTREKEK